MSKPIPIDTVPTSSPLQPIRVLVYCNSFYAKRWVFAWVSEFDGKKTVHADGVLGNWDFTHWMPEPESPL